MHKQSSPGMPGCEYTRAVEGGRSIPHGSDIPSSVPEGFAAKE